MTRRDRLYVVLLVLVVGLAVVVELVKPVPVDWTLSFEQGDARPHGCRILYELLPALFPEAAVRAVDLPPYLIARAADHTDAAYVFITQTFAPDPAETEALLGFAARGNTVFVSATDYGGALADSLGLEVGVVFPGLPLSFPDSLRPSAELHFVNPTLQADEAFVYERNAVDDYFERFDTLRTTVLGTGWRGRVNYVRIPYGDGAFLLSTVPLAFTNYYVLHEEDAGYVVRALSYLSPGTVLWDAYYKPNRSEAGTPLRYVLRQPSLRAAYWVLVALVVLFVLFEARRRQRVVPVIEPLTNTTLEFVETVGHLYFDHGNHANLAEKKISYFLEYLRTHLRLPTGVVDDALLVRVAERSGVPVDDVRALFACIGQLRGRRRLAEDDLHRLNRLVEAFYRQSRR